MSVDNDRLAAHNGRLQVYKRFLRASNGGLHASKDLPQAYEILSRVNK
jgi:hypothetical protein